MIKIVLTWGWVNHYVLNVLENCTGILHIYIYVYIYNIT